MVLWIAAAYAVTLDEVPNPRANNRWVSDLAAQIDDATEARLEALLDRLHTDTTAEVAVVTVDSVAPATPKAFATGLFNHWKMGDEQANNGLLVLLVLDERRLEMETGYGLEAVLADSWLGNVQRNRMVPAFKEGRYGQGLYDGLVVIDARLRQDELAVREGTRGAIPVGSRNAGTDDGLGTGEIIVLSGAGGGLLLGVVGIGGMVRRQRRIERTCPTCQLLMPMLDSEAEQEHLDEGQKTEEAIRSVDWQVHRCTQCSFVRTFRVGRWFSGYSSCPECSNQTRSTQTTTLQHATQYSGGLVEITEDCAHCSYHRTYTRSTPRLPPPSTSSSSSSSSSGGSSGGSSFGGGSSGGGGAGSSW